MNEIFLIGVSPFTALSASLQDPLETVIVEVVTPPFLVKASLE
jgi:hypothetical protein